MRFPSCTPILMLGACVACGARGTVLPEPPVALPAAESSPPPAAPARLEPPVRNQVPEPPAPDDIPPDQPAIVTDQPFQLPLPSVRNVRKSLATRLANLSPGQCRAELRKRAIGSKRAGFATPGVATPMRLDGALRGVRFIAPGTRSVFGILDCRLALALDELAELLSRHDVRAVHVDSMYRPRARLNGSRKRSQHSYGLAVDIIAFTLADGSTLSLKEDWHGALSAPVCGPGTQPVSPTPEALKLWTIVCDIAQNGLFHHMLTPNYNPAHEDHLHFDIKRDGKSLGVR